MNGAVSYPANQLAVSSGTEWIRIAETATRVNQSLVKADLKSSGLAAPLKSTVRAGSLYLVTPDWANPAREAYRISRSQSPVRNSNKLL